LIVPSTSSEPGLTRSFIGLQAARGAAAVLVVLYHTGISIFGLPKYGAHKPFGNIFDFGKSGVDFFFVLSGFIILHAHWRDIGLAWRVKPYLWKRFRRIYPIYWTVLAAIMPVFFLISSFGKGYEKQISVILSSIFLVHLGTDNAILIVSWTLFHEVLFYVLFAVALWKRSVGVAVLGAWFAGSLFTMSPSGVPWIDFYFSWLHLLFAMGMGTAWWLRTRSIPMPALWLAAGIALFWGTGMEKVYHPVLPMAWRDLLFGAWSVMMLMGLVELDRSGRLRLPAWSLRLGDASYSIYLVHFPALSLFAKLILPLAVRFGIPGELSYLVLLGLAVMTGVACHLWVEKPLLRSLSGRGGFFKAFRSRPLEQNMPI
jgi:peptidoglycan/LPS O-acetylase OafA/YrhL